MSATATYLVTASWFDDAQVRLQVNLNVLTPELATEINTFWSGANDRLSDEDGDVVRSVVRLFGVCAIQYFMRNGGANASASDEVSRIWTADVIAAQGEGWPGVDALGILIKSVVVRVVDFDDVSLEAV